MKSIYNAEKQYSRIVQKTVEACKRQGINYWSWQDRIPIRYTSRVANAYCALCEIMRLQGYMRVHGVLKRI